MKYKYCENCRPEIHTSSQHTNGKKCRIAACKCSFFKLDQKRIDKYKLSIFNNDGSPGYPEFHKDKNCNLNTCECAY